MCGIAGIISGNPSFVTKEILCTMTDAIRHRGPDGEQHWINLSGTTGLGHRRLAILDLSSAGAQPMHYRNRYTILHNGEIYNYIELRKSLQDKGHHFRSGSDTEVILAAYAEYGPSCCSHLDGMFAFAIWDEHDQQLFAARDRFGEKPFYYAAGNDRFIFASETKAIRAVKPGLDIHPERILAFLTLGHTRNAAFPGQSIYQQIAELPPASSLTYNLKNKTVELTKYWQLHKEPGSRISDKNALEKFGELWKQSLKTRLRSDVEIGCSLSGGLDSSSIVAGIRQIDNRPLKTFSAVFPGFERDESGFVDIINNKFNTDPRHVTPDPPALVDDLEKFIWHQEAFVSSASIYAQYAVFKRAKEEGTVVLLDGQGADETLAGYTRYIHWGLQELYRRPGSVFNEAIEGFRANKVPFDWSLKNKIASYHPSLTAFALGRRESARLINVDFMNRDFLASCHLPVLSPKPGIRRLNDILHYDVTVSGLKELLHYADRNSMAHGREVRLPFLSHELVSFIFTLPVDFKLREGYTKWILRKAMAATLPDEIVWRKDKVGYEPPQKAWMETASLQERIHESKRKLVAAGILHPRVMHKKIQPLDSHAADNFDWRFLVTALLI